MASADKAFQQLGLRPTSSPVEVKQRWRKLCMTLHPDRGGNPVEFDEMRRAYKLAFETASAPRACSNCDGLGKVRSTRGFSTILLVCSSCGGTGHAVHVQ